MRAGRINQSEIGRVSGIPQANVSRWFNGQSKPTDENVATLAKAFKITPAQMRGEQPIHGIDGYSIPTEEDEQFFRDFVSLSDETKALVRDYIRIQKKLMDENQ